MSAIRQWLESLGLGQYARLLQQQDCPEEARALLQPIYDWFTEGFDTKDIREAKVLLVELTS